MQLVPIIPQPRVGVEENLEVTGVAAIKPAKPVLERTLPPLLSYAHALPPYGPPQITQHEKRKVAQLKDRRLVCRRIQRRPLLEEIRSAIDRRRHTKRSTDYQFHIDEEV